MCGIAGYLTLDVDPRTHHRSTAKAMTDAIRHRGPDSDGQWLDEEAGIALGMRRLAVVDLSPAGAQPMISLCGRYVLVFNGEIYNHKQLRAELEAKGRAPNWRGHSDTEVLTAAIATWGLLAALRRTNGMFAIALWDRDERKLSLACDRFGEKPVYCGWSGRTFLFGSELKSLATHPSWTGSVDRNAVALLMRFGYVVAPHSIYHGISKLQPGTVASLSVGKLKHAGTAPLLEPYWSAREMVERARSNELVISEAEALDQFDSVFTNAVGMRMEADVPLGAFLSGGYDSTAVVATMQRQGSRPVRTFTIGFSEPKYNEAPFAGEIARHLGTDHTELYVSPAQAMQVIPSLPSLYDEPFADSSQIPTFLVSQLARRHVTVALSGDGGDELFGGYNRYFLASKIMPSLTAAPYPLRRLTANAIRAIGSKGWDGLYNLASLGRGRMLVGDKALKLAELLSAPSKLAGYHQLVSSWQPSEHVVSGAELPPTLLDDASSIPGGLSFVEQMMFLDLVTYLPGDILTKVDRATMGVSLEGRVPFLDPQVAEFAWRLPLSQKVRRGGGKRILKQFVHRFVPQTLMDRPKTGFGVPIGQWLRGPLREWAESLLGRNGISAAGFFDADLVVAHWEQHVSGQRNWESKLWPLLMFQAWLEDTRHAKSPAQQEPHRIVSAR